MRVTTPVPGFSGEVAGVLFADGVGESSDPRAIAYFARHGYGLGDAPVVEPVAEEEPVEDGEVVDSEEPVVEPVAEEEPAPRGRRRS